MKTLTSTILALLCLPVLVCSQPLVSNLENQPKDQQEQHFTFTEADFIQPAISRVQTNTPYDNRVQKLFTEQPGLALLSSGILPGSGQLANKNWLRGGLYTALEVAAIYMIVEFDNRGDRGQRRYEKFADQNWSVTQYAKWLVEYHDKNEINYANPEELNNLEELKNMVEGLVPAFDTSEDWQKIDIDILRDVERQTRFVTPDNLSNSNFSHILPGYGSQQYYELISKYYQFQAGWQDYFSFHETNSSSPYLISRDGNNASSMFFEGASLADDFNNDFRTSKNFKMVLIANHVLSAFDSFFTYKLKQNRIQATTSMAPGRYLQLSVQF